MTDNFRRFINKELSLLMRGGKIHRFDSVNLHFDLKEMILPLKEMIFYVWYLEKNQVYFP